MAKFTVSHFAETDLEEILLYLAENNKDAAIKFIREMMKKFDLIANNPKIGTTKGRIIVGLRLFPFNNYNIFYFQTEFGVEIYRVLHSSRDNVQVFDDTIDDIK
jgi:toxin ParE1/3/4